MASFRSFRGLPWPAIPRILIGHSSSPLSRPVHVFLCLCDHYEPKWARAGRAVQTERVARWRTHYPESVAGLHDSIGRSPQHTFFYPEEEYEPEYLDQLAGLCQAGFGDVEVHLHHDGDTSAALREKLGRFIDRLHDRHGLLRRDTQGRITYGFIHGNWALDNSRPDGRWCGVNDEITILRETGCYADFTMPAAPDACQTRTVNSIYYAIDDPERPKSHDTGTHARVGADGPAAGLLMIQGPLVLDWRKRKWGVLPRLENGDLHGRRPPTWDRFQRWCRAAISVHGRPDWIFVKLHTHGAQEKNAAMLLGEPMRRFHHELAGQSKRNPAFRYYYVTARETADLVHQAEQGAILPSFSATTATAR